MSARLTIQTYPVVFLSGLARTEIGVARACIITHHLQISGTLEVMIKGIGKAIVAVVLASALDMIFYDGRYTDAALAMLREIRRGFGI